MLAQQARYFDKYSIYTPFVFQIKKVSPFLPLLSQGLISVPMEAREFELEEEVVVTCARIAAGFASSLSDNDSASVIMGSSSGDSCFAAAAAAAVVLLLLRSVRTVTWLELCASGVVVTGAAAEWPLVRVRFLLAVANGSNERRFSSPSSGNGCVCCVSNEAAEVFRFPNSADTGAGAGAAEGSRVREGRKRADAAAVWWSSSCITIKDAGDFLGPSSDALLPAKGLRESGAGACAGAGAFAALARVGESSCEKNETKKISDKLDLIRKREGIAYNF